ncbi:MAG: hypothetical protein SPE22_01150, partial [Dialister sp.]|nr:hypothetical protein [Dialister sp.]
MNFLSLIMRITSMGTIVPQFQGWRQGGGYARGACRPLIMNEILARMRNEGGGFAATFISNFAFKRSFQTQSKGSIPQGLILNPKRRCEITI